MSRKTRHESRESFGPMLVPTILAGWQHLQATAFIGIDIDIHIHIWEILYLYTYDNHNGCFSTLRFNLLNHYHHYHYDNDVFNILILIVKRAD